MIRRQLAASAPHVVVCLVIAASCSSPVDLGPPHTEGTITEVLSDQGPDFPIVFHVEDSPANYDPTCPGDWYSADSQTEISITTSTGSTLPADSDELRVGARAMVWQIGSADLDCQGVGRARRVIVLEQQPIQ